MAVIEAITTTYLEAEASSVTFSSIPQTYKHLQIRMSSRNTFNYKQGNPRLSFNGTAGTAYSSQSMNGVTTTLDSDSSETGGAYALTPKQTTGNGDNNYVDRLKSGDYAPAIIDILDYADVDNKNTTVMAISGASLTTGNPYVSFAMGLFDDPTEITSITLDSNGSWMRGSVFTLYGINE